MAGSSGFFVALFWCCPELLTLQCPIDQFNFGFRVLMVLIPRFWYPSLLDLHSLPVQQARFPWTHGLLANGEDDRLSTPQRSLVTAMKMRKLTLIGSQHRIYNQHLDKW